MKIISYISVIPAKNKSEEKLQILTNFAKGVSRIGDEGLIHRGYEPLPCDVAIIQGWQHERGKTAPHLALRQKLIDRTRNTHVITADSNLFLYANTTNKPHHYLRYSINGIFPTTGNYCDDRINPKRWEQISRDCNIQLGDMKHKGKHIVLCCQRDGGWSMGNSSVIQWANNCITELRKYTDMKIIIRGHPGDKSASTYLKDNTFAHHKDVIVSRWGTPLERDLQKAWAVVNHNSSSVVGPIIMGYHAFVTDPQKSQCAEVANTDFSKILSPAEFDREKWLQRISMFHWKFSELQDGTCWSHMRNYCQ